MTTSCIYCGGEHNSQACPGRDGRPFAALALCLLVLSGCTCSDSPSHDLTYPEAIVLAALCLSFGLAEWGRRK